MRICSKCATKLEGSLGHKMYLPSEFEQDAPCERCQGPGPCAGVASKDVVSGACRHSRSTQHAAQ